MVDNDKIETGARVAGLDLFAPLFGSSQKVDVKGKQRKWERIHDKQKKEDKNKSM